MDFAVNKGSTEMWEIGNNNGYPRNFHVHDVEKIDSIPRTGHDHP